MGLLKFDPSAARNYNLVVGRVRRDLYLLYESLPAESLPDDNFHCLERVLNVFEEYHGELEANELNTAEENFPLTVPQCLSTMSNMQAHADALNKACRLELWNSSSYMKALEAIGNHVRIIDDCVNALAVSSLSPAKPGGHDD